MELKEFVKETLTQISEGVQDSLASVRDSGGYVNPATRASTKTTDDSHFASMTHGRNVFLISFDVAVTVEEESGKDGHAKLKVASVFSAGGGGSKSNKSSSTNHISFKVPLALPVDPITEDELKTREAAAAR
ncbi:MAG: hypothetical protein COB22_03795 [Cycloclasticus sp.]|nr:MAG: hypothetical protein COB22_03795 [Cycloclasticus sp.]